MKLNLLSFVIVCLTLLVVGCGQGDIEETQQSNEHHVKEVTEANLPSLVTKVAAETVNPSSGIDFSWIEQGYDGRLDGIPIELNASRQRVIDEMGEPLDSGSYEGGEFLDYGEVTFFINPESETVVAIAVPVSHFEIDATTLYRNLGTPDISELDHMENLWTYHYEIGDNVLLFEAEEEGGTIIYAWLRTAIQ
ncbi:hypothetical protein [Bacillus alkalicellulosilyticus]|uniref:hypothetical protein n=1 Tax=Alkalihalobacterium alkalicellulosilyticum TaxID=1912214 RepID=UPI000998D34C|nr:hypothetical protein [Bacillus alkalicellulosilyticus]